jgi:hypothetical protein
MPKAANTVFRFTAPLSEMKGGLVPHVIFLPDPVVEALPDERVRAEGTFNGVPFALAPQYKKDGRRYFAVSAALKKACKIAGGSPVKVEFRLADPKKVEVPEELEAVLAQDDAAMKVWRSFTYGLQRSLIHYITSVKNVDSRITRALQMMEKAKAGLLTTQQRKETTAKKVAQNKEGNR